MKASEVNEPDFGLVDDFLHDRGVFESGIDGRPQHMDSYMSCVNWAKLESAWKEVGGNLDKAGWMEVANHMDYFGYLSPNCSILASFIARKVGGALDCKAGKRDSAV